MNHKHMQECSLRMNHEYGNGLSSKMNHKYMHERSLRVNYDLASKFIDRTSLCVFWIKLT